MNINKTLPVIKVYEKDLAKLRLNESSELGVGRAMDNLTELILNESCQETGDYNDP